MPFCHCSQSESEVKKTALPKNDLLQENIIVILHQKVTMNVAPWKNRFSHFDHYWLIQKVVEFWVVCSLLNKGQFQLITSVRWCEWKATNTHSITHTHYNTLHNAAGFCFRAWVCFTWTVIQYSQNNIWCPLSHLVWLHVTSAVCKYSTYWWRAIAIICSSSSVFFSF